MRINEINPDNDWLLYHGSQKDFDKFNTDMVYLTQNEEEAFAFALNVHRFGADKEPAYVYTVSARPGKIMNIDNELSDRMMNDEDPDDIINEKALQARKTGYRYLEFTHPGAMGEDFEAIVSLYPNLDLEVVDKN